MRKVTEQRDLYAYHWSLRLVARILFCVCFTVPTVAENENTPTGTGATFQTEGTLTARGEILHYQAIAQETLLPANQELPVAQYFSFTYLKKSQSKTNRPVTFLFNGGPGSASHWLHLGGLGPKQIPISKNGQQSPSTIENSESLLGVTDLVFIDPVGTGFSTAAPQTGETNLTSAQIQTRKFWGVVEDTRSVTDFILAWLQQQDRMKSPVYLVGESYGALRATLIADELERKHQLSVKGLVLLSAAQNYRNIRTPDGSVMGYMSYFPTYAATAWHHKKAGQNHTSLENFLAEARHFAANSYATALIKGNRLSQNEKTIIADKISYYTGLSSSYILDNDIRIKPLAFLKQILSEHTQKISRLDSRHSGSNEHPTTEIYGIDPYANNIREPFTNAVQTYLNGVLNVPLQKGAYITTARTLPYWHWNWNVWGEGNVPSGARFINVMPNLDRTLASNPRLKVFVGAGYYDLATPFYSIENAFSELKNRQGRIAIHHYSAGHIIYLDDLARQQLLNDINAFIISDMSNN